MSGFLFGARGAFKLSSQNETLSQPEALGHSMDDIIEDDTPWRAPARAAP